MVVKHNWLREIKGGMVCGPESHHDLYFDCIGCFAAIPYDLVQAEQDKLNGVEVYDRYDRPVDLIDSLDRLWHEELRPMAELCSLVEEATCQ